MIKYIMIIKNENIIKILNKYPDVFIDIYSDLNDDDYQLLRTISNDISIPFKKITNQSIIDAMKKAGFKSDNTTINYLFFNEYLPLIDIKSILIANSFNLKFDQELLKNIFNTIAPDNVANFNDPFFKTYSHVIMAAFFDKDQHYYVADEFLDYLITCGHFVKYMRNISVYSLNKSTIDRIYDVIQNDPGYKDHIKVYRRFVNMSELKRFLIKKDLTQEEIISILINNDMMNSRIMLSLLSSENMEKVDNIYHISKQLELGQTEIKNMFINEFIKPDITIMSMTFDDIK